MSEPAAQAAPKKTLTDRERIALARPFVALLSADIAAGRLAVPKGLALELGRYGEPAVAVLDPARYLASIQSALGDAALDAARGHLAPAMIDRLAMQRASALYAALRREDLIPQGYGTVAEPTPAPVRRVDPQAIPIVDDAPGDLPPLPPENDGEEEVG